MTDVSVIIVNWNAREVLRDCLASIYAHTRHIEFEVIVVDNASRDGSTDMIKTEFPSVRLIENAKNTGFAAANNQGMAVARGDFFLLINPDTVVLDGAIQKTFVYAQANPSAAIVGCKVWSEDGTLQETTAMYPRLLNIIISFAGLAALMPNNRLFGRAMMRWWDHNDTRPVESVAGCFMLVRREAVEQVGRMDERYFMYGEEIDWGYRFHKAGWKIMYFHEAEIIHLIGKSSEKSERDMNVERRISLLAYFRKNRGAFVEAMANVILMLGDTYRIVVYTVARTAMAAIGKKSGHASRKLAERKATLRHHLWGCAPGRASHSPRGAWEFFKKAAKAALALLYYALVRAPIRLVSGLFGIRRQELVVLGYHAVADWQRAGFAWQMDTVLKAGMPVDLEDTIGDGLPQSPDRLIAVTFDDALESVARNALPELASRCIPSTIFVPSACMGDLPTWPVMKSVPDIVERVMTKEQLREIAVDGVKVGSHGVRHMRIGKMPDEEAFRELADSKRVLEDATGRPVTLIAFPYGDFSMRSVELAVKAGYMAALSVAPTVSGADSDAFLMGRVLVEPDDWALEFWLKLRGAYEWMAFVRTFKRKVRVFLGKEAPSWADKRKA